MLFQPSSAAAAKTTSAASRPAAAVVEFAVIVPLLVAVLLGFVEVTRAVQVKNQLTDMARSGCRLAIQPGSTNQSVTANIKTILTNNGIDSTAATITILVNNNSVDVSTASQFDQISVKIAVPFSKVTWVTPVYMSNTSIESETLVMMHQ